MITPDLWPPSLLRRVWSWWRNRPRFDPDWTPLDEPKSRRRW